MGSSLSWCLTLAWRWDCPGEQVPVALVVDELGDDLLEEELVAYLKGGEVQGVGGLLVDGVIGPQDQPHHSFLHRLSFFFFFK
ncbi:hypothetical protein E2C01_075787 [Portunus trituberculatus]|uniref:Uncharacterized protein n=1 Tax=Portunus trituberculatus TaxID=210409 RepID=A0A5B7I6Z9_PORTR|nr:hypothetical protein [Portunus trituberculatus]